MKVSIVQKKYKCKKSGTRPSNLYNDGVREGPNSESDNEGEDYKYIDGEGHVHVQSEKVSTVAFRGS
jgi:hypothetical protein